MGSMEGIQKSGQKNNTREIMTEPPKHPSGNYFGILPEGCLKSSIYYSFVDDHAHGWMRKIAERMKDALVLTI